MGFKYSSSGIETKNNLKPLPNGDYILRITLATPAFTKNKDPMVIVDFEVEEGDWIGYGIRYHNVTFFNDKKSKGAGIALHFLHAIGEPYEGDFEVNPLNWINRILQANVVQTEFNGRVFPKIKYCNPPPDLFKNKNLEEVPF